MFHWLPTNPEARLYGLFFLVAVVVTVVHIVGCFRADSRADEAEEARDRAERALNRWHQRALRAEAKLSEARRRSTTVDEYFEQHCRPLWTRPGPPADATTVLPAVDATVVMTADGTALVDAT